MPSFNKVILAGNLTRDPELRYTPKGTGVAQLSIAVNRTWRDPQTNEQKEDVTFVDVTAFGRQAETIAQYLKKGRPLLIEGRLKLETWDDKTTNQKRSKLGVILESFQFLDSNKADDSGPARTSTPPLTRPADNVGDAIPPEEDDVPF